MQVSKEMMGLQGAGAQLKEEAFISICDLLIVFGHCGEASGQAPLKPLAFKPDEGMGVLLNIFIQDHVFIEDEDEDIDDHQKIEELHKRRFENGSIPGSFCIVSFLQEFSCLLLQTGGLQCSAYQICC